MKMEIVTESITLSQTASLRTKAEDRLKEALVVFYNKKPKLSVKGDLIGFTRNLDHLADIDKMSYETMAEAEFQPLTSIAGTYAVVVFRTISNKELGYGVYGDTATTILTMDLASLLEQILPDGDEPTYAQREELKRMVENMEKLVGIQYT